MNPEPFYVRLRRLRLAAGYESMNALASAADVYLHAVQNWELGRHRPTWENLRRLSRLLHVSTEELMYGAEQWDVRDEWLARAGQNARAELAMEIEAAHAEAPVTPLYRAETWG